MKSSGECKFYQFNVKFKPAFCQYNVVCSANFRFFSSFQRFFTKICQNFRIKMSKILHFHFQKSIFGSFSNSFSFFFIVKQQIFSVWRFSTANFQAFIFFNFVFMKIFFRLNFVKFKCEFFSDFWRIKIQNFRRNFLGSCTLRKSIGEVRAKNEL